MMTVVKYRDRRGTPYRVNREPWSEITCERIAKDNGSMSALQVAVQLALGTRIAGSDGRSYRIEERAP